MSISEPAVKLPLIGLDREQLKDALLSSGLVPEKNLKMRIQQLWNWIYQRGASSFFDMTTISKNLQADLDRVFTLDRPEIHTHQKSCDGTQKWLLKLHDGNLVEMVFIPDEDRGTLCISSQVGCTLNCSFCHTGTQKLVRNLTAAEIIMQVMVARDGLRDWGKLPQDKYLTNIVLMGMGEPLYNFDEVKHAMLIVMDGDGIGIGKRRVTLSTSGVVPMIERVGNEIGCNLAISLHAVNDETRNVLVPLNKKYNITELLEACRTYPTASNARRITFEYVMLKGINDSREEARHLVRLLEGIPAKINLIPFNPWPNSGYECSDWEQIEMFADVVNNAGYASPIRTPRGRDILAACGQLKSASEKVKKSVLLKQQDALNEMTIMASEGVGASA